jgi:ABC-type nitrate/sulfonate/bicarbonate transport system permease component
MNATSKLKAWIESAGVLLALMLLWWLASHLQWIS